MKDIKIPNTFVVVLDDGEEETWESSNEEQFAWGVGPGGDLMVFRAIFHTTFQVKMSDNDTKYYCYAAGSWKNVRVEEAVAEAEEATVIVDA